MIAPLIAACGLQACAGAAISGSTFAVKAKDRPALREQALQGDAQAQYELGKSWCCMGPGFDAQTATEWLCRAAAQDHPEALFELGRIYEGDVSRTPAPGQKIVKLVTAKQSIPHALAFYAQAARFGHPDAMEHHAELSRKASDAERNRADVLRADFSESCEYDSVF